MTRKTLRREPRRRRKRRRRRRRRERRRSNRAKTQPAKPPLWASEPLFPNKGETNQRIGVLVVRGRAGEGIVSRRESKCRAPVPASKPQEEEREEEEERTRERERETKENQRADPNTKPLPIHKGKAIRYKGSESIIYQPKTPTQPTTA